MFLWLLVAKNWMKSLRKWPVFKCGISASVLPLAASLASSESWFHSSPFVGITCLRPRTNSRNVKMPWPPESHCLVSIGLACHVTISMLYVWRLISSISRTTYIHARSPLLTHCQFLNLLVVFPEFFVSSFTVRDFSARQRWIVLRFREACMRNAAVFSKRIGRCEAALQWWKGSACCVILRSDKEMQLAVKKTRIACVILALRCRSGVKQFPLTDGANWYSHAATAWFINWRSGQCAVRGWLMPRADGW